MRTILIDILGLAGFGCLMGGVYLRYGLDVSLISGGAMLVLLALASATRGGRR
ncbi:hypothetical protein R6258_07840 [Halomonas sp. HP20-15]|uniref:hypothetical protein n=1 Tax=Halomonas sp. HP20-15 TaxID=3085901 RepID=UPI0029822B69|nr:hypothetical protein [Halomonas sp. HP20-15]MDW5376831.1 hypothetical protein [Halomonas sp. HP20-15]